MVTPPDKTEQVLQAINHLRQSLENFQVNSDRADKKRDAKIDAIGNDIGALRAQVDSQGRQINVLGDRITDLTSRMDGFDRRMDGFGRRMDGFEHRMDGFEHRMDGFDRKLDGIRDDIGLIKGGHARNAMRQNLARIVDQFGFKLISPVPQEGVIVWSTAVAADNGSSPGEAESFGNADMIANVLDSEGKPSYLALEASYTVANNDIRRAARNAAYLKTLTGLDAYAGVAGVQVLPEAQARIDDGQVSFYQIQARELQSE